MNECNINKRIGNINKITHAYFGHVTNQLNRPSPAAATLNFQCPALCPVRPQATRYTVGVKKCEMHFYRQFGLTQNHFGMGIL